VGHHLLAHHAQVVVQVLFHPVHDHGGAEDPHARAQFGHLLVVGEGQRGPLRKHTRHKTVRVVVREAQGIFDHALGQPTIQQVAGTAMEQGGGQEGQQEGAMVLHAFRGAEGGLDTQQRPLVFRFLPGTAHVRSNTALHRTGLPSLCLDQAPAWNYD